MGLIFEIGASGLLKYGGKCRGQIFLELWKGWVGEMQGGRNGQSSQQQCLYFILFIFALMERKSLKNFMEIGISEEKR